MALVGELVGRDGRRRVLRVACGGGGGGGWAGLRAGLADLKDQLTALLRPDVLREAAGPHGDGEEEEEQEEEEDQDEENNTEIKTYPDGPAAKRVKPLPS